MSINILNQKNLPLLIIFLVPTSFILGSFFVNLITSIIILLFLPNLKKFEFKANFEIIFLFLFFILIIFSSIINQTSVWKSILYIRFFFFIIAINFFLEKSNYKLNNNYLLIILSFCSILVIFSLILEYFFLKFGINWYGSESVYTGLRFSGVFFDEYIAGWYLFTFGLMTFIFLFKEKKKLSKFLLVFIIFGIFLSGSRSPLLSLLVFTILTPILFYNYYKFFIKIILGIIITTILIFSFDKIPSRYTEVISYFDPYFWSEKSFDEKNPLELEFIAPKPKNKSISLLQGFKNTQWGAHYLVSIEMFKEKKYLGHGMKSFREKCKENKYENIQSRSKSIRCSSHTHLVFLEILSETGIFSFIFFYLANIFVFLKSVFKIRKSTNLALLSLLPILLITPYTPSGSIFSTNFATAYWFLLSFVIYLNKKYS